jgi:hypothetical protein
MHAHAHMHNFIFYYRLVTKPDPSSIYTAVLFYWLVLQCLQLALSVRPNWVVTLKWEQEQIQLPMWCSIFEYQTQSRKSVILSTEWCTKWSNIWFCIKYSTMQSTMFCNMVNTYIRSWRLVLTLPVCTSVMLFLLMCQFTQDGWQMKTACRATNKNSVVLYWNKKCCGHIEVGFMPFSNMMDAFIQNNL